MRGLRQAALLVRPTVRSLSWAPLAAAGALAFGLLGLTDQGLTELRLAAIGICVGAAFILDDAAAATVASAPTPLLVRRALRVGLATAPLAALWALLSWLAGGAASWAVSLELAAMLALTLAAAAVATRLRGAGRGGVAAGPALLVLLSAAYLLLPSRWGLFPGGPQDPLWTAAHQRWALILLAGVLGVLWAGRDPAWRPLGAWVLRRCFPRVAARHSRGGDRTIGELTSPASTAVSSSPTSSRGAQPRAHD